MSELSNDIKDIQIKLADNLDDLVTVLSLLENFFEPRYLDDVDKVEIIKAYTKARSLFKILLPSFVEISETSQDQVEFFVQLHEELEVSEQENRKLRKSCLSIDMKVVDSNE